MKNIILLSDGTGQSARKRVGTNVRRLHEALDLSCPDRQIAMYDDGVGTGAFLPERLLGGAFGYGLKRNVLELYEFLCRNYETGDECGSDRIYLFGFSRGAFTVRLLAGLIGHCGLYTRSCTERELRRIARRNFRAYRRKLEHRQLSARVHKLIRDVGGEKWSHACSDVCPKIEFIGVWDTVDAYGLPVDELTRMWDCAVSPLRFPDQNLGEHVDRACHALAVDEERKSFEPVLWSEGGKGPDRIEQVWFPGVHTDVGGGYPRHGLSLVSLDWMISKVEHNGDHGGLRFREHDREEIRSRADPHGVQHDSRSGLATYYRYGPRNIERLCNQKKPGLCNRKDGSERVKIATPKIHDSVFRRIEAGIVPYAPTGIPVRYQVVATRGAAREFETEPQRQDRAESMNAAMRWVRRRAWLYRGLLATTIAFVASPWVLGWERCDPCSGIVCLLEPAFRLAMDVLPSFAEPWVGVWLQHPLGLVTFVALLAIHRVAKAKVLNRISAHAAHAWRHLKARNRLPAAGSLEDSEC